VNREAGKTTPPRSEDETEIEEDVNLITKTGLAISYQKAYR
jgi:hypothetical protein